MSQMDPFTGTSAAMPPLRKKRNPSLAALIGFLFGGIGLGIYFASLIDFFIPILIVIILSAIVSQYGFIGGALIAGVWGYFRAVSSNEKLERAAHNNDLHNR